MDINTKLDMHFKELKELLDKEKKMIDDSLNRALEEMENTQKATATNLSDYEKNILKTFTREYWHNNGYEKVANLDIIKGTLIDMEWTEAEQLTVLEEIKKTIENMLLKGLIDTIQIQLNPFDRYSFSDYYYITLFGSSVISYLK